MELIWKHDPPVYFSIGNNLKPQLKVMERKKKTHLKDVYFSTERKYHSVLDTPVEPAPPDQFPDLTNNLTQ